MSVREGALLPPLLRAEEDVLSVTLMLLLFARDLDSCFVPLEMKKMLLGNSSLKPSDYQCMCHCTPRRESRSGWIKNLII